MKDETICDKDLSIYYSRFINNKNNLTLTDFQIIKVIK